MIPSMSMSVAATSCSPKPALSVPLMLWKKPRLLGYLNYRRYDLNFKQPRLAGRYALRPEIDFADFRTRAVIDWITIGLLLCRPTQFQWIQHEVETLLGRRPFVENIFGDRNESSIGFDMRIQEPDIPTVLKVVAAIDAKFGLDMFPIVRAIEISIDFTPKQPNELDRARMARVLMNHLMVDRDVLSDFRDRPRTVIARGQGIAVSTTRLLYDSARLSPEENKQFLISNERDRAPAVDGTYHLGARESPARWRVMDKVIDRQNIAAGTFVALDEKSKRARVEVTLDRPEVAALGITYLDELRHLNFTQLQGRYFRFFLPTFVRTKCLSSRNTRAATAWIDRQRAVKFSKTGNIGLKAMDDVMTEERARLRRRIKDDMHKRDLRLPAAVRHGSGKDGTFAAYEELNERATMALRKLGERVAAGFC